MEDGAAARMRYSAVAIILHWTIAILILYNLGSGLLLHWLPRGFFAFHVASGFMILALTVLRIIWRLTHRPPSLLPVAKWEKHLAHVIHFLLYGVMLAAPLTGWAMLSTDFEESAPGAASLIQVARPEPHGIVVFGKFELPKFGLIARIADQPDGHTRLKKIRHQLIDWHLVIGWTFLGLLVLHLAGALKHQLIDRRRELARMGLGRLEPVA